ncbi:DUF4347 domain-containing protein [Calothrix sp. PCC 6303]|uniref:DUF4347 domain-containing protein n=1 Tax=Calothrix sp. PCC 6303 TaxID=1170562 RepID=UPI0002A01C8B|nr:DUF4347 domain-containing protein [Calothrix sp. PCC 6303]AFZ02477.1 FG-GAP repeat protein [Calothrix sp. PCC 6303]
MSFELPGLGTPSAGVLSTTSLTPVFAQNTLTTSLTGLAGASQSLLFVDGSVTDYQQLVAGVIPGTEIHVLDPVQDAVTQITNTLLGRQNIGSLHIVSHGEAGGLDFGSSQMNLGDLPGYTSQLQSWGKALTNDADILLYGCNVAEGQLGQAFVQNISQITGADVAASDNLTGSKALGGDWVLESKTGAIETGLIFDPAMLTSYSGVLTTTSPTNSGFETGDLTGWTVQNLTSPNWNTTQTVTVVSSDKNQGTYSAKIDISGSVSTGGGTAYGPTITSSYFEGDAGDTILFDWKALQTSDYYDVKGEIVNDSTGQRSTIISEVGTLRNWTTTSVTLPVTSSQWKFVFTAGSYDATFGRAVGSTLYIDNIRVVIPAPTLNTNASPTLSNTVEDISAPTNGSTIGATLVSALIDNSDTGGGLDNFTNPGGSPGLAVTGVNSGTLYYTTNGGSTWNALNSPSITASLLLAADSNTYVYFKPDTNVNGSISDAVTFKAWNGFDGTNGQANVNTTTNAGVSSQSDTASISVTPVNDAPTISTNSLSLSEGGSVVLSSSNINATDPDNISTELTYTASSITGGQFELVATSGVAITSFTQAQINSGAVRFVHGGGETAPSYSLIVNDGSLNSGSSTVAIGTFTNVNDAPTISTNALSVSEGGSVVLSNTNINATDPDTTPAQLTYTASSISGGQFELVATSGVAITSFTQAQINSGAVRFVHGGGETAPSYSLIVNDGSLNSGSSTVAIGTFTNVNDAPTLTGNATLTAVTQNTTNSSGSSLTSLFGSLFTDPDTSASLSGLAIVGNTANTTTEGRWEYSTDGTNWASVGAVADGATALALSVSTLVRFVPVTGYNGTPPGLTVRALDNSYSNGFTNGTTRVTINTTSNGGTTAISSGTPVTLNTSVTKSLPNLLWRNSGNGENAVWQIKNDFTLQSGYFITQVPDANWEITGTDDFNGDGIADIVWRNKASGENAIWEMKNDFTLKSGQFITQRPDANWQIAGTDDFNQDGTPDILWYNKLTGKGDIWEMNAFRLVQSYQLLDVINPNWSVRPFVAG